MSEQTVVIGDVVEVRSGVTNNHPWTIWKVTDGNGTDLGSCLDDVANAARPLIGKRAVIVNEIEENHKDGKTFKNLKLRSVEPEPEHTASNGNGEVDWDGKELRGHRRASVAIASSFLGSDPSAKMDTVLEFADMIVAYVYGADDANNIGFPVPPGGFSGSDSPPLTDDDIPF